MVDQSLPTLDNPAKKARAPKRAMALSPKY
jgi:hypothetical protein